MIQNHLFLPIYEDLQQQNRYRPNCENRDIHTFICPNYTLPGFFFTRPKSITQVDDVVIRDLNGNLVATLPVEQLHTIATANYDGIGYTPQVIRRLEDETIDGYENWTLPCGLYYIEITETLYPNYGKKYYSELFRVVDADAITDGEELVFNGKFIGGSLSGWATNGTWDASTGKAVYSGGGGGYLLDQTISYTPDKLHLYRIEFTISNFTTVSGTPYLRVYSNGLNTRDNVKVSGNGTYVFYVNDVSRVLLQMFTGSATFAIDNISIQKIVGWDGYVGITAAKTCTFPNSDDGSGYEGQSTRLLFYNNLLLDAKILAPQYGEDRTENETGNLENILTFVRAYKLHAVTPLQLPEAVVDAVHQLNTCNYVQIHNSESAQTWQLASTDDSGSNLRPRTFVAFSFSNEWQPGQCYALSQLVFEENLSVKSKCCDVAEAVTCFDEATEIEVVVTGTSTGIQITLGNTPTGMDGAMVLPIILRGADCDNAFEAVNYPPDSAVTWAEFAENGIFFTEEGFTDYVYTVGLLITQFGCDSQIETDEVCSDEWLLEIISVNDSCDGDDNAVIAAINIQNYNTITYIEFWNSGTSTWEHPTLVVDGSNEFNLTLAGAGASYTKARLRNISTGNLSAEVSISLSVCG